MKGKEMRQKLYLKRALAVVQKKSLFKKEITKPVFRVVKAENFAADKFYEQNELDKLLDMGVDFVIDG